ncbi:MAG: trehalose-phosphatase [Deltaproteobacteria bacterium]|jgi:alpha,alpha-trehalase|nr:trehalose-phosphatase [Deltaproteobacteria bacterium]MCL5880610.1 trehalose-phosphatase [Deltaproteobacteria bacterium]MDA8303809.1 trehalose-phosphatase [Deltaproteobacteria bacterium]
MLYDGIERIDKIKKIIAAANPDIIVFCIDFDGTLVKICKSPYDVVVTPGLYNFLTGINNINNIFLCIVTGRELTDVEQRVNIKKNIIYSGNHGFEIKSYYKDFKLNFLVENAGNYIPLLTEALSQVKKKGIDNLIIENKKFSISMHYRLLNSGEAKFLKQSVKDIIAKNPEFKKYLHITKGKKILEIRPRIDWNKGSACRYLVEEISKARMLSNNGVGCSGPAAAPSSVSNKRFNILRVNIGDDITDETMFSHNYSFNLEGNTFNVSLINCVIGKKQSLADFYLKGYNRTPVFIKKIIDIFSG